MCKHHVGAHLDHDATRLATIDLYYCCRLPPTAIRKNHERLPQHCIYCATSSIIDDVTSKKDIISLAIGQMF
jgi:hypothetical protein